MIELNDVWSEDDQPIALTPQSENVIGTRTDHPEVPETFADAMQAFRALHESIDIETLADPPELIAEIEQDAKIDTDPMLKLGFEVFTAAIRFLPGSEFSLGEVRAKLKKKFPNFMSTVTTARAFTTLENSGCGKTSVFRNTLKFKSSMVK